MFFCLSYYSGLSVIVARSPLKSSLMPGLRFTPLTLGKRWSNNFLSLVIIGGMSNVFSIESKFYYPFTWFKITEESTY